MKPHVSSDVLPIDFEALLRKNGLSLTAEQVRLLSDYVRALLGWNKKINLLSRRDVDRIWESHIFHCLSPLLVLEIPPGVRVLDLGTGGGLPGIPLAIGHGALQVTLLDSIQKKIHAVEAILKEIGLPGVDTARGRAEQIGREAGRRAAYDVVVSRAVGSLPDLVLWARPFLRKKVQVPTLERGKSKREFVFPYLLALKGGDLEKEREQVGRRVPGLTITEIELSLYGSEHLGLVDKKLVVVEFP